MVAWLGAGCVSSASALVAGTFPVPVARGVVVARLPFLVVGLGLVVTISLGSVKGA